MKVNLQKCRILLACFIFLSNAGICQFTYKANIGEVKQPGFHKVSITPSLSGKCNADFSDIRIVDQQGKFIPYLLNRERPVFNEKELRVFPLVSQKTMADSNVQIIFQPGFDGRSGALDVDSSFLLVMQSADAYRNASISGSYDLIDWYTIIDRLIVDAGNNINAEQSVQVIALPLNRYKYLRLVIKNNGLPPIRIAKAGSLLNKSISGQYSELPAPVIKQVDSSNKKSYIAVSFNEAYPVSKIRITISAPRLYKRKLSLYDTSGKSSVKVGETMIDPSTDSLMLDGNKRKELILVVENNDDDPLRFSTVAAYQLQHFIVADLQQGKRYNMLMGNSDAAAPVYDLKYFADSIKVVEENLLIEEPAPYKIDTGDRGLKPKGIPVAWIWIAIGIVLAGLLWLTYRLIKDISNKQ